MQRICKASGQPFEITPEDLEFYKKVSPQIGGKIFEIPPPTLCPEERQRRRQTWRNEMKLYQRKCDATGADIVSQYPADAPFPVFSMPAFLARKWPIPEQEFSFDRPFFSQFHELMQKTPRAACSTDSYSLENNSIYQNAASQNKDCYLIFAGHGNEDCLYGNSFDYNQNCLDGLFLSRCEWCYECVDCLGCNSLLFSQDCQHCSDSAFLFDCRSCHHCIGCVGLRQRSYSIFNEQFTPQEYEEKKQEMLGQLMASGILELAEKVSQFSLEFPRKYAHIEQCEDCGGDYLQNCRSVTDSFMVYDSEDCRYSTKLYKARDCMDVSDWGNPAELLYECASVGNSASRVLFSSTCWPECHESLYSDCCSNSSHLFGCIGLYRREHCILNKQYSKEEYEALVPQIIEHMRKSGEWGEFFPVELSPFAYNETIAQEYFPLTKEEVLAKGWKWRDETNEIPKVEKIIPAHLLPDSIKDIPDDILNWAVECEVTKKPFIIQKPELEFYRKMNLPIPHLHPDVRRAKRMAKRNPRKLWERSCDNCGKAIETSYSPDRPEKVFCERCYTEAVY